MLVPTEQTWRYTTQKPGDGWTKPELRRLRLEGRPGRVRHAAARIRSTHPWKTDDIWLRREMTVPEGDHPHLQFIVYHDEDVEIYVNGISASQEARVHDQLRAAGDLGAKRGPR